MVDIIIPILIAFIMLFALIKGVDAYSSFVKGAKGALPLMASLLPYIIAMFVVVHSDISKMVILKVEDYMLGKWEELLGLFSDLLHGTITDQNVDDIVDVYERMMPLFQNNEKLKVFQEELEWFSAKYQHHNIEFKR